MKVYRQQPILLQQNVPRKRGTEKRIGQADISLLPPSFVYPPDKDIDFASTTRWGQDDTVQNRAST
jgi:hypothetical protein